MCVTTAASSNFKRIGKPAAGDQTRMVMLVAPTAKGIVAIELLAPVEMVVPAQTSEGMPAAPLINLATLLVPPAGSVTTDPMFPPKSVSV